LPGDTGRNRICLSDQDYRSYIKSSATEHAWHLGCIYFG
jgi:hypothetical protein